MTRDDIATLLAPLPAHDQDRVLLEFDLLLGERKFLETRVAVLEMGVRCMSTIIERTEQQIEQRLREVGMLR